MGIMKIFKRSRRERRNVQEAEEAPAEETRVTRVERNDEATSPRPVRSQATSPRPVRSQPSFRRRLSTGSMKKLRRIGQCLRLIGDDLERRSPHGGSQYIATQDPEVTNQVLNTLNGQTGSEQESSDPVNQESSNPVNQESSNSVNQESSNAVNEESKEVCCETDVVNESSTNRHSTEI